MKRLMRNANLRFGFGKATSGPATKGEKGSMAATEFSSTSAYSSLDRLSPLEGTAGASAAAVNRRGRGGRAAALTSTIGMMIAVVVAVMAVVAAAVAAVVVSAFAGAAYAVPAEAATPAWKVIAATGPTNTPPKTSETQRIEINATGGTFTLSHDGQATTPISFNPSAAAIRGALEALPGLDEAVEVRQVDGSNVPGRYLIGFGASLRGTDIPQLTADASLLTGGPASVSVTTEAGGGGPGEGTLGIYAANMGGAPSSGPLTLTVGPFPPGVETAGSATGAIQDGWSCTPGAGLTTVTCTRPGSVPPLGSTGWLRVPIRVLSSAAVSSSVLVSVDGGGATPVVDGSNTYLADINISYDPVEPGVQAFWAGAFDADGAPATQAGGHPNSAATMFMVNTNLGPGGKVVPVGDPRDVVVDLPVGFVGNPMTTVERCPRNQPLGPTSGATEEYCDPQDTTIGWADVSTLIFANAAAGRSAVVNAVPPPGYAGHLGFLLLDAKASVVASVRDETDYGVTALAPSITPTYKIYGALFALEGTPAATAGRAFLTNPTECTGGVLPTWISASTWQSPGAFSDPVAGDSPPMTGCELVPFEPAMSVDPTSTAADSASGLEASVDVPQENLIDPDEIATSHLKKTVVELPQGLSVNPSGATGLRGCSDAQIAIGSKADPSCPEASKLGTVEVTSPLVDQPLSGVMYLGTPKSTDPMSGDMLRLFLVVRNDELGILVKLPGSTTADPQTGKLTATFDENPRVPFDHLEVALRGGSKGLLATPQDCGSAPTTSTLSPWSGTADVARVSPFEIAGNCGRGFAPRLAAGMSSAKARGGGSFSFRFSREDGEQVVDGLSAKLPEGLLASVRDVPLCSSGQAAAGACPEGSRIGLVDATAGAGNPFVLERKGSVYLTEGYKGCAYGLLVSVPVVAGPFDGSSPETDLGSVNVRQAVCVDPTTAEVSAISDPLPTIWHGIPLRVRSVTVIVDRSDFMLNPSGCSSKQTQATFDSDRGATANAASRFVATACAGLPFEPNLTLGLTGRRQVSTGKHPGVKAKVTQQGLSEAGIEQAVVRLPKSLALDPNNAQALCEFTDGTKPDLENHCPKGSIVGRARAKTPLLKNDLAGDVYFVKNVRIDPKTGNQIRTLPMIIVALRGEIAINLRGESSTTKAGRLVNTFADVPDAPISQFNLNIEGGNNGILAVTRTRKAKINLCAGRHIAEADMDGHNGRRYDTDVRMKTPCSRKQTKAAKLRAKRAAAKVKRG